MVVAKFSRRILLVLLWLVVSSQVHGRSIEKRSDDSDPLTSVVEQLRSEVTQLQAQVQANENDLGSLRQTVAFTVQAKERDVTGLGLHQIIKFDNVLYNAGNGYNPTTGTFTVPASGTYAFHLQVLAHDTDERVILDLMKNGHSVSRAHAGFSPYEDGSTVAVLHMNQGDSLYVEITGGSSFIGTGYTTFAGFRFSSQ